MSRRKSAKKRRVLPDARYGSMLVTRFVNCMMLDGKKATAEKILYGAFDKMSVKAGSDALHIFEKAIESVRPEVEVRSRRIGGATYQVPTPIRPDRAVALAMRWIIGIARKASGRSMSDALCTELLSASNGSGLAIKKRDDTHKMAESNRALAHYRW